MIKIFIILACLLLSSCSSRGSLCKDPQSKDYGKYTVGTTGNVKVQVGFAGGNQQP